MLRWLTSILRSLHCWRTLPLPPGVVERCVAGGVAAGKLLHCWRSGVLVSDPQSGGRTRGRVQLTTESPAGERCLWLEVDVRGACDVRGLWPLLTLLLEVLPLLLLLRLLLLLPAVLFFIHLQGFWLEGI